MVKKQAKANDAAWRRSKAQLEAEWKKFEAEAAHQLKTAARQTERKAAFQRAFGVQAGAWHEMVKKLQEMMRTVVPARRTGFKAAIRQIKTDAANAEARMRKLGGASATSWPTMHAALVQSRDAFDRANHKASEVIRRAFKE